MKHVCLGKTPCIWGGILLWQKTSFPEWRHESKKNAAKGRGTRSQGKGLREHSWDEFLFFFSFLGGRNRSAAKTMAKEPYDTTIHPETMTKVVCPGSKIGSKKKKKNSQETDEKTKTTVLGKFSFWIQVESTAKMVWVTWEICSQHAKAVALHRRVVAEDAGSVNTCLKQDIGGLFRGEGDFGPC